MISFRYLRAAALALIAFSTACGNPPATPARTGGLHLDSAFISRAQYDSLAWLAGFLDDAPEVWLGMADKVLDDVEGGREPKGSFSDYFVPVLEGAKNAGAHQDSVNVRLDRLVRLARAGKYISDTEADSTFLNATVEELRQPTGRQNSDKEDNN